MNLIKSMEFKVGALVLAVASLVAYMSIQVSEDPSYLGKSQKAWFYLGNANGLIKNSSVKMAGIPVGVIKDIRLENGLARVEMVVSSGVGLRTSAEVEIKSVGILGDKNVELHSGNPADDSLPDGGQIVNVRDKGSLDSLISQVGEIGGSLSSVAKTLQKAVEGEGDNQNILGRIVKNIENVTEDLSHFTAENREDLDSIVKEVRGITKTLNETLNDPSEKGFKKTWKKSLASIEASLKNIEEITGKINTGEGTIGKLVNDETTVEEINSALEGINGFLDTANRTQTSIDFHAEHLANFSSTKSYIGVRIQPGLDRYYEFSVIDDPVGVSERTETTTTTGGGAAVEQTETKRYLDRTKLSFLFAKNFYDFSIKGGLIENAGGLGFDYYFWKKKVRFSLEAFDFGRLNLRASLRYDVVKNFYLIGGMNDMMDKNSRQSSYIGAGLFITNDDLKFLGSSLPF